MADSTDEKRTDRRQPNRPDRRIDSAGRPEPEGEGLPCPSAEGSAEKKGECRLISRRRFLETSTIAAAAGVAAAAGLPCCSKKNDAEADPGNLAQKKEPAEGPPSVARATPRGRVSEGEGAAARPKPRPRRSVIAGRGHIFSVTHPNATDRTGRPAIQPVEKMLDRLMLDLTGKRSVKDAWAALFKPKETVALKPNTLGKNACSPSFALMAVIIKKLRDVGVSEKNILVWDRDHLAQTRLYTELRKKTSVRVKLHDAWGYEQKTRKLPSGGTLQLNNALLKADAVINIPVFKDHSGAGMTGALKNMAMGSVDNPWSHHPNACNPAIPEIYALSPIKDKVRLIVADGFEVVYEGGPGVWGSSRYKVSHESLYATRDPVTMDRIIWQVIDRIRKSKGKKPLMKRGSKRRGRPIHVVHASKIGLGEVDLAKIKHKNTKMI
jgi:uncharacterized protein (DUF362 family)